jgi:hypothetical protein
MAQDPEFKTPVLPRKKRSILAMSSFIDMHRAVKNLSSDTHGSSALPIVSALAYLMP